MEKADGLVSQSWEAAKEGDEGKEGDGEDCEEDVSEGAHWRRNERN